MTTAYYLSPIGNGQQFFDNNGDPLDGGLLYTYEAESTDPRTTYTDAEGNTENENPIELDSAGRPPQEIWLQSGLTKFVLKTAAGSTLGTWDNIPAINDATAEDSQWVASGLTPTYISATSFTVTGDQTSVFTVGRRLQFTLGASTVYGTIYTSAFTTLTTVVMAMDSSGNLDNTLTAVSYSLLTSLNPSLPAVAQQTIASAATINLASARGPVLHVSGNTGPVTSFGNAPSGVTKFVVFDSTPTLTHNGTSLILLGAANRVAAAGDIGVYSSEGGGNWRELAYAKASGAPVTMSPITASLGGDVALNNTSNYFAGPTIAQGSVGVWFVSGTVTLTDSGGAANYSVKLWDGTSVIDSARPSSAAGANTTCALSGYISAPAGDLRISVKDATATTGSIVFNSSGESKDSTITAFRIG